MTHRQRSGKLKSPTVTVKIGNDVKKVGIPKHVVLRYSQRIGHGTRNDVARDLIHAFEKAGPNLKGLFSRNKGNRRYLPFDKGWFILKKSNAGTWTLLSLYGDDDMPKFLQKQKKGNYYAESSKSKGVRKESSSGSNPKRWRDHLLHPLAKVCGYPYQLWVRGE